MPSSKNNRDDRSQDVNRGKPGNSSGQETGRSRGGKQDISSGRDLSKSGRSSQDEERGRHSQDSSYGNHLDEE